MKKLRIKTTIRNYLKDIIYWDKIDDFEKKYSIKIKSTEFILKDFYS